MCLSVVEFNGDYIFSVTVGKLISAICAVLVAIPMSKKLINDKKDG